jgi:flagellar basal-body rod modification protein FlgD
MEIPASLDIVSRLAARESEGQSAPGELGRDAFLELLVNQLTNQDPLSPLQDHEFIAQLATFSNLEQLEQINSNMRTSILLDQSVNNSLATNLIGKEVLADGSSIALGETDSPSFQLELAASADVVITIRNANGDLVRRMDQGAMSAGETTIEWDGMDESGNRAAPGEYEVEVLATSDEGVAVRNSMRQRALVTGVKFIDGTGYLTAGNSTIPLANVLEVFAASVK